MTESLFPKSMALFERARRVIPAGIYGHTTPAQLVPTEFPYYAARAEGCRYWDADGREYLDFLCSYGPIVLGYRHPEVEEAAERQRREGDCFNHPTALMVELAERLVSLVDFAAWCVFGKNGSDMTTWAVQVAREFTGRKKVLRARQSYHGSHAWCTPGHGGLIEEDRMHVHDFVWNDSTASRNSLAASRSGCGDHHDAVSASLICRFNPARGRISSEPSGDLPQAQNHFYPRRHSGRISTSSRWIASLFRI